ncbi:MAG: hypothetical protein Q7R70_05860 [Candidatus Diapherotrites archaeon]|nr:hypothetical protein [Candidatus Diapherotrites archaeon]
MPGFFKRVLGKLSRKPKLEKTPARPAEKPKTMEGLVAANWKSHFGYHTLNAGKVSQVARALEAYKDRRLKPGKNGILIPEGFDSKQLQVFNSLKYHVQSPQQRLGKL